MLCQLQLLSLVYATFGAMKVTDYTVVCWGAHQHHSLSNLYCYYYLDVMEATLKIQSIHVRNT